MDFVFLLSSGRYWPLSLVTLEPAPRVLVAFQGPASVPLYSFLAKLIFSRFHYHFFFLYVSRKKTSKYMSRDLSFLTSLFPSPLFQFSIYSKNQLVLLRQLETQDQGGGMDYCISKEQKMVLVI
jgi:hypothetical protein